MFIIRDFQARDAEQVNKLAVEAFTQYQNDYSNWPQFISRLSNFSNLSSQAEITIAEQGDSVVGAVAYVGPKAENPCHFPKNTPIIRMLIVAPNKRGLGIGKRLTRECIARAKRDSAKNIALHTSPIMEIALAMYLRLGFKKYSAAPAVYGVEYNIYLKDIAC